MRVSVAPSETARVAICTVSAPSSSGFVRYGVEKVLPQMTLISGLYSCAMAAVLRISVILRVGLAGVSR